MFEKAYEYDLENQRPFINGQWVTVNNLKLQLFKRDGQTYLLGSKKVLKKLDKVLQLMQSKTILSFASDVKIKKVTRRHGYINGVPNICKYTGRLCYANGDIVRGQRIKAYHTETKQKFGRSLI